jgi:hypothetical protein
MPFFEWVESAYDPEALQRSFQARGWASRLADQVLRRESAMLQRATSRSGQDFGSKSPALAAGSISFYVPQPLRFRVSVVIELTSKRQQGT